MKTTITISGQISGTLRLRNVIITSDCKESRVIPNSIVLIFSSKKQAVKALSEGYQRFCREMPEEKGRFSGFRYSRGSALYWDASKAILSVDK